MRDGRQKRRAFSIALILMMVATCFVMPQRTEASDGDRSLSPRQVYFKYGYTDSNGTMHWAQTVGDPEAGGQNGYLTKYEVTMLLCNTNHYLQIGGVFEPGVTEVEYSSSDTGVLEVDNDGLVTLKKTGEAVITAHVSRDDIYDEATIYLTVTVAETDGNGGSGDNTGTGGNGGSGDNTGTGGNGGSGDNTGTETGGSGDNTGTGGNGGSGDNTNQTDPEADAAAAAAAQQAATNAEIAKAKALKAPSLTVKAQKGRKNKLTWGKVANADGYIVYIKYPGQKTFKKVLTKNATVKSVTHKGLRKRKYYSYKVRAYKVVNGKYYYGPFSKVRKVRAK